MVFRELSFSRLECGVHDRLHIYPLCGIFYFPWHRHQIEGSNGFYCLIRKTERFTISNVESQVFTPSNSRLDPGSNPGCPRDKRMSYHWTNCASLQRGWGRTYREEYNILLYGYILYITYLGIVPFLEKDNSKKKHVCILKCECLKLHPSIRLRHYRGQVKRGTSQVCSVIQSTVGLKMLQPELKPVIRNMTLWIINPVQRREC